MWRNTRIKQYVRKSADVLLYVSICVKRGLSGILIFLCMCKIILEGYKGIKYWVSEFI